MEKIKILHVIQKISFGGVESVVYNYCSNINTDMFEFYILSMKDGSDRKAIEKFEKLGFKFIFVDNWEKKPFIIFEISRMLKKYNFDIIHSHISFTNFYFMIIGKLSGIKIRISHSHLSVEDKNTVSKIKHFFYKQLIYLFSTDYFACGSDAAINLYGRRKCLIFNNAIELDKYKFNIFTRNRLREKLGFDKNDYILCSIGRLTEQKNQLFLLEIFKNLLETSNDDYTKLLLIGNGDMKEKIEKKILDLNLSDHVTLLSNRNDIPEILQAVGLFLLPSLYEGLPVVGVEAQASGLKCLFSDKIDSMVALVENNCNFISIENGTDNWVDEINKNRKYCRKEYNKLITKKGFNIKEEANKLSEIYLKLFRRR